MRLNREGVPGPTGKGWTASTINGNRKRGIGILNNEAYAGILVCNRQRFLRDPHTGKRVTRFNPEDEWMKQEVPEWRLVEPDLWCAVKERQQRMSQKRGEFNKSRRPTYLTSGLVKCGCCGSSFVMSNHGRLACSRVREKGTCSNTLKIDRAELEGMILKALQGYLMDADLVTEFCEAYIDQMNALRAGELSNKETLERELEEIKKQDTKLIDLVCNGHASEQVIEKLKVNETRTKTIRTKLTKLQVSPVLLHPKMAERYEEAVENLVSLFSNPETQVKGQTLLRPLIERIDVTPNTDKSDLRVDLHGDLAGILSVALGKPEGEIVEEIELTKTLITLDKKSENEVISPDMTQLVAEVRCHRYPRNHTDLDIIQSLQHLAACLGRFEVQKWRSN